MYMLFNKFVLILLLSQRCIAGLAPLVHVRSERATG